VWVKADRLHANLSIFTRLAVALDKTGSRQETLDWSASAV
jgi:hypothetical protein